MIKSPVDRFVPILSVENSEQPRAYRISPNTVLLFHTTPNRETTKSYLREETERLRLDAMINQRLMYGGFDVHVPITAGVAHFKLPKKTWFGEIGDTVAARVLGYVEGISANSLPLDSPQRDLTLQTYIKMLDRIGNDHSLDLTPVNTGLRKIILMPDNKICLYDFSGWKQGNN